MINSAKKEILKKAPPKTPKSVIKKVEPEAPK